MDTWILENGADIIIAYTVTVIAFSIGWEVCKRVIEATKELDEQQREERKNNPPDKTDFEA